MTVVHPYAIAGFLVAILPLIATPGASLTLLIQRVTSSGRRQAALVILGTASGLYVHAALAIAGLSALVMQSGRAFTAVKLAGAAYLIGLAIWTWRSATRTPPNRTGPTTRTAPIASTPTPEPSGAAFRQAFLANVLNPKAASIYLTLVPQFMTPERPFGGQILTLATVHALLMAIWLITWTLLIDRAAHLLRRPRFKRVLTKASAAVLLVLGLRTAAT